MTVINSTITAVVAALQAAPAVATVGRVRLRPLGSSATTAVVVRPVGAEVQQASMTSGYPITWDTKLGVECYARAAANQAPDVAVDALVATAYARLMQDPTLGGAVIQLMPEAVSYDFDADDQATVCATLIFTARQRAPAGAL